MIKKPCIHCGNECEVLTVHVGDSLLSLRHPIVYSKRGLRNVYERIKCFFGGKTPRILCRKWITKKEALKYWPNSVGVHSRTNETNHNQWIRKDNMETIGSKKILHSTIKRILENDPADQFKLPHKITFCGSLGAPTFTITIAKNEEVQFVDERGRKWVRAE